MISLGLTSAAFHIVEQNKILREHASSIERATLTRWNEMAVKVGLPAVPMPPEEVAQRTNEEDERQ